MGRTRRGGTLGLASRLLEREKVQIIIEELSNTSTYNANLMSYLNSNTKVVSLNEDENQLVIDFNDYIYNDIDSNEILEFLFCCIIFIVELSQ